MNKLKQLTIGLAIALVSIVAPNANAGSGQLDTALGQIYVSSNPAQEWKAAGMHGYVGHSGRIRFKQKSISLYNITPPSFSAGCNGISWNLGGLSFIDGEELIEFLQATGQAMAGQIILLAAKTICEPCTTTLETIQEWAQKAAMDGINSCNVAKSLVGKLENTSAVKDVKTSMSGFWDSVDGGTDDFQAGLKKIAEYPQKINKGFRDFLKNDEAKADEMLELGPNPTWDLLRHSGMVPKTATDFMDTNASGLAVDLEERIAWAEIVMSMLGTFGEANLAPTLNANDVFDYVKCGVKGRSWDSEAFGSDYSGLKAECESIWEKSSEVRILTCSDGTTNSLWEGCYNEAGSEGEEVTLYAESLFNPAPSSKWIGHKLYKTSIGDKVATSIAKALDNIDANKPPYDQNAYILTIMKVAPFDLYRVLNIASVSPSTSRTILEQSHMLITNTIAQEYLLHSIDVEGLGNKYDSTGRGIGKELTSEIRNRMNDIIMKEKGLDKLPDDIMKPLLTELDYQRKIMMTVESVERKVAADATHRQVRGAKKWLDKPSVRTQAP